VRIPTKFTIPDTIEGVAGLLTARKWEKAAIVYAWTLPQQGRRTSRKTAGSYGIEEFAGLGIAGLRSPRSVEAYRAAWVWAIESGWTEPVDPGDEIDLEDLALVDFPPVDNRSQSQRPSEYDEDYRAEAVRTGAPVGEAKRSGYNKAAVEAAVAADPEVAAAAQRGLNRREEKRRTKVRDDFYRKKGKEPPPVDPAYQDADDYTGGGVLGEALTALDVEIDRMERGDWIKAVLRVSKALERNIERGLARFEFTTVPEDIERVRVIQATLSDAAFKFSDGFIPVDTKAES